MAYTKTEWKDQNVENPRTYSVRDNGDSTVTLMDAFGTVTELGTPVNAENMNKIEDGIANAVDKDSNQTITGKKVFNTPPQIMNNLSPSTSGSKDSNIEDTLIIASTNTEGKPDGMAVFRMQDKEGNREVQYRGGFYAPTAQGNKWPSLDLGIAPDEITYAVIKTERATAPHPAASTSTSNQAIMTVGRAADPAQNFNLLHRSGNESITGVKTVENNNPRFGFKNTLADISNKPSARTSSTLFFLDKNGLFTGEIRNEFATTGYLETSIYTNSQISGTPKTSYIKVVVNENGEVYATCPTPPRADDNSTKISTTQWVNSRITSIMNNKLQVVASLPSSPKADTFYFIPED